MVDGGLEFPGGCLCQTAAVYGMSSRQLGLLLAGGTEPAREPLGGQVGL